jgi:hypothetical protein
MSDFIIDRVDAALRSVGFFTSKWSMGDKKAIICHTGGNPPLKTCGRIDFDHLGKPIINVSGNNENFEDEANPDGDLAVLAAAALAPIFAGPPPALTSPPKKPKPPRKPA